MLELIIPMVIILLALSLLSIFRLFYIIYINNKWYKRLRDYRNAINATRKGMILENIIENSTIIDFHFFFNFTIWKEQAFIEDQELWLAVHKYHKKKKKLKV